MASKKEDDPNQSNSEVCGSRKGDSKHVRGLQGNTVFSVEDRFPDRFKAHMCLVE